MDYKELIVMAGLVELFEARPIPRITDEGAPHCRIIDFVMPTKLQHAFQQFIECCVDKTAKRRECVMGALTEIPEIAASEFYQLVNAGIYDITIDNGRLRFIFNSKKYASSHKGWKDDN